VRWEELERTRNRGKAVLSMITESQTKGEKERVVDSGPKKAHRGEGEEKGERKCQNDKNPEVKSK